MHMNGPIAMTRNERLDICREIASRLHEVYGESILAIGIYGSIARGTDGPYSDIEMFCVLRDSGETVELCHEWSAGPWKAEVDVWTASNLLHMASTVEGEWPLTHGPFFTHLSLYDPEDFFPRLRAAAESPPEEDFRRNIQEVLVGEMYEFAGKLRNVSLNGPHAYLPYLAMEFAHYGAMLIGLHHRKLYSTGAMVLPEAIMLPDLPDGYAPLARMVMSGQLSEPSKIVAACEDYWNGLVKWADEHGYVIHTARIPF